MFKGRIRFVLALLVLAWSGLLLKVGKIQLVEGRSLERWARREQQFKIVLEPERGNIYDRMHRLLASSVETKSIGAFLPEIKDRKRAARLLADLGAGSYQEIYSSLKTRSKFVWIKRNVSEAVALGVLKADIPGISVSKDQKRYYPMGTLGGNLLGFVGRDRVGLEGVEYEFESALGGSPGWAVLQRVSQRGYPFPDCPRKKALRGKDLVLTIDANIQSVCEEELRGAVEKFGAKNGMAIVLNPRTGEILAMSNYPSYDPNEMGEGGSGSWKNRAITDVFEPGSTFKIVADAAVLDKSLVKVDEIVDSGEGVIEIGRRKIRDVHKHGPVTFSEAVAYSGNVAAVKISRIAGKEAVYETARAFGFGNKTGIQLPGEAKGHLSSAETWSDLRFANVALGQGITVTALQLAMAYGAIANGGVLLEPVILKAIAAEDAEALESPEAREVRRVMSKETAARLSDVLTGVVEYGTGTAARLKGISVAGKTGTAEKVNPRGGYAKDKVVCSFAGFLPAEDPRLVIVVVVDDPQGRHWGSDVAAPAFKGIASKVIEMRPYQSMIYSGLAGI